MPGLAAPATPARRASLKRGDLLPRIMVPPPGPEARALSLRLAASEAPTVNTVGPEPAILWAEARGANVLDVDGNVYVDLTSGFGVASLGHRNPRVVEAVRRQSGVLLHAMGDVAAHPLRVALAEALCRLAPVDDPRVYFAASGADAVEIALKTAVLATGRTSLLAFDPGYHGLTLGALAATSREEFRRPFAPLLARRVARLPFGCPAAAIERVLKRAVPACAIVEPVVGREGVLLPPDGWLTALAAACRRHGVLLVADEILTGFGRTGRWFAVDEEGLRPDLLLCGKALGGGLPLAAVIGRRPLMEAWRRPGEALHTSTFLAHPLACAAALASLSVIARERMLERMPSLSAAIAERLAAWKRGFSAVAAVRGRGLLWGVELTSGRFAQAWVKEARARGVLMLAGGALGNVAQICPPFVISHFQLEAALVALEEALGEVAGRRGGRK